MRQFTVIPYLNQTSRFDPYTRGDELKVSAAGVLDVRAESHTAAASQVFAMLNADDRPNGAVERSLSVGDVLVVETGDSGWPNFEGKRLAVDPVGFREV
jgi:hypothetical protein